MSRAVSSLDFEELQLVCFDEWRGFFVRVDSDTCYCSSDPFEAGLDRWWNVITQNPHGEWTVGPNGYLRFTHQNGYFEYNPWSQDQDEGNGTTLKEYFFQAGQRNAQHRYSFRIVYFRFQGRLKTPAGTECKITEENMARCYRWYHLRRQSTNNHTLPDPASFFEPLEPETPGLSGEPIAAPPGEAFDETLEDLL